MPLKTVFSRPQNWSRPECTKIARFSAVAAAIFTAPPQNRAISSAKKIASERRFSLRLKGTNLIPTAEFPAIPESAAKIASERRCAILVQNWSRLKPLLLKHDYHRQRECESADFRWTPTWEPNSQGNHLKNSSAGTLIPLSMLFPPSESEIPPVLLGIP